MPAPTVQALLADLDAVLTRLADEPSLARESLGQFAIVTFLVGDRNGDGDRLVEAITLGLGLSEDDVERLMPHGRITLESLPVTPPGDAARYLAFLLICAVAATSRPPTRTQVQVLAHLGASLGIPEPAVTLLLSTELGLPLVTPLPVSP